MPVICLIQLRYDATAVKISGLPLAHGMPQEVMPICLFSELTSGPPESP